MRERLSATLSIKRDETSGISTVTRTIATVPITEGSVRAFMLMQYDYIRLSFTLASATHFRIGDYIEDDIFGKFVITKQQMPGYNATTGGYDYNLQFDAEYYLWANKVFMLTTVNTDNNTRIRKETDWCLTDKLSVHLDEVIHNLTILGYTGVTYTIDALTATEADEVRFIEYSGIDIISALSRMAEAWNCEWWVLDNVIHFGKCEDSGEYVDYQLGVNVETMEIRNNMNSYANKLFAYGSTKNLPFNYRKTLVFDVKDVTTQGGITIYGDTARPITPAMIDRIISSSQSSSYDLAMSQVDREDGFDASTGSITLSNDTDITITQAIVTLNLAFASTAAQSYAMRVEMKLIIGGTQRQTLFTHYATGSSSGSMSKTETVTIPAQTLSLSAGTIEIETNVTLDLPNTASLNGGILSGSVRVVEGGYSKWTYLYLESDTEMANPYKVIFNPLYQVSTQQYYGYFKFDSSAPSNFISGTKFILDGLNATEIPDYYYTTNYNDPSSLAKLGEVRLELPEATGGFIAKSGLSEDQTVESVIVFDDIYPHAIQKVTSVTTTDKESEEDQQDGIPMVWAWIQYTLQAALADGTAFNFKKSYLSDEAELQIKFISREDLENANYTHTEGAEYRLAGMTFNVEFNEVEQTYTIVRNEDFGAKLPNKTLKPMVGDPFVLTGWNVKAMEDLNLISAAEALLQSKTQAYLNAMEEDQFTFACNMMSSYFFELGQELREKFYSLDGSTHIPFHEETGAQVYVKMPEDFYILPIEGKRVRIIHGALSESKISRVIGYQMKLDKPYDSPQYEVGETERYSRLSIIEKEITKLS